MNMSPK